MKHETDAESGGRGAVTLEVREGMKQLWRISGWLVASTLVAQGAFAQPADEGAIEDVDGAIESEEVSEDLADEAGDVQDAVADEASDDAAAEEGSFEFADDASEAAGDADAEASTPGADMPETVAGPTSPMIEEGLLAFEAGDFQGASLAFYDAMMNAEMGSDIEQRAQFETARSLARLNLLYGARLFFDEIIAAGPSHLFFEETAPWVMLLARELQGDSEMLSRVAAFEALFPERIDQQYRDEFAFALGEHFYNVGELERAVEYFGVVTPGTEFYTQALFRSAIAHVRLYDAPAAVERLKDLLRVVEADRGDDELQRLGMLARLTIARTFYSTGEYDKAIDYYTDIPQSSDYWLDAIFEASWAYFQLDQYNRALGNLHSLNSPFFNDEYYPEAPVLQAVIFFYNCQFQQVRLTLDEFNYVYVPLREELQITVDSFFDNMDAYEFLASAEEQGEDSRDFDPRLQQIVDAALSDVRLVEAITFVDRLDEEIAYIDAAPEAWSRSELGDFLYTETVASAALSKDVAGELVLRRLSTVLTELQDKERQASAILVETDLAEADALSADIAEELEVGGTGSVDGTEVHPEQMFWRFDGEYWRDELGYYSYNIASQCSVGEDAE